MLETLARIVTNTGVATATRFAAGDLLEEQTELGVEQLHIFTTEYLSNKVATFFKNMSCDIQSLH